MSNFGSPRFTGYRTGTVWKDEVGIVGESLDFTNDEVITKLGIGMVTSNVESAMDTALRYTLVTKGEDIEMTAKDMVNEYTIIAYYIEANIIADAGLGRWVITEKKDRLWRNNKCSGWNYHHPHVHLNQCHYWNTYYHLAGDENNKKCNAWNEDSCPYHSETHEHPKEPTLLYLLDDVRRELINDADQKEVLRAINKSLNRMINTGKVIKTSEGRGRTFKWTDWNWLRTYRQEHLFSESKKRKVGDVVNGWIYSVVSSKEIHGVKIDTHGWKPVEQIKYYTLEKPSSSYYRSSNTIIAFFLDKESRDALYENTNSFIRTSLTPLQMPRRTWYGNEMEATTLSVLNQKQYTVTLILKPEAVVEDLPDPLEFFKQVNYNHKRREELLAHISKQDGLCVVTHKVKEVEVVA